MHPCSVCGRESDCFEVISGRQHFFFDRVECAIEAVRSRCNRCGDKIYAEATDGDGNAYCSDQCAYAWDDVEDWMIEETDLERSAGSRAVAGVGVISRSYN